MKRMMLFTLLLSYSIAGHGTIQFVTSPNASMAFNPDSVTIYLGDTVRFFLGNVHDAVEVSKENWDTVVNQSGVVPLSGGFSTPLGGGYVYPAKLPLGVHYYVCTPHVSMGMKARLYVVDPTNVDDPALNVNFISAYPNPVSGKLNLTYHVRQNSRVEVKMFDVTGKNCALLFSEIKSKGSYNHSFDIDRTRFFKGIYIIELVTGNERSTRKIFVE